MRREERQDIEHGEYYVTWGTATRQIRGKKCIYCLGSKGKMSAKEVQVPITVKSKLYKGTATVNKKRVSVNSVFVTVYRFFAVTITFSLFTFYLSVT